MSKGFGELFSNSWKEYKENLGFFIVLCLLLLLLPAISSLIFNLAFNLYNDGVSIENQADFNSILNNYLVFLPFLIILMILSTVFNIVLSSALIYFSLYKKGKMSVLNAIQGGLKYFWRLIGFGLLYMVVIFLPFIFLFSLIFLIAYLNSFFGITLVVLLIILIGLLIIAYFIFAVYLAVKWIFTCYVIIGENKGVMDSMKISSILVKKDWGTIFGYLILFLLISYGIGIGISIIQMPLSLFTLLIQDKIIKLFTSQVINVIFTIISNILLAPLTVLFIKNLYLDRKKD